MEVAASMARLGKCDLMQRYKYLLLAVQVTVSVTEIYCERICDLLNPSRDNLQVQQEKLRGITVAHATETPVASEAELVQVMQQGLANRAVASTAMNAGWRTCSTIAEPACMPCVSTHCHACDVLECPALRFVHALPCTALTLLLP